MVETFVTLTKKNIPNITHFTKGKLLLPIFILKIK